MLKSVAGVGSVLLAGFFMEQWTSVSARFKTKRRRNDVAQAC